MTRKDYELIAASLKASHKRTTTGASELTHKRTCMDMAETLEADNPRFDFDRFMQACGY